MRDYATRSWFCETHYHRCQFAPSRANQASQPDDFSPPQTKRDVPDALAKCETFDAQDLLARRNQAAASEGGHGSTNHQLDQIGSRQRLGWLAGDDVAIAQYGDVVGEVDSGW